VGRRGAAAAAEVLLDDAYDLNRDVEEPDDAIGLGTGARGSTRSQRPSSTTVRSTATQSKARDTDVKNASTSRDKSRDLRAALSLATPAPVAAPTRSAQRRGIPQILDDESGDEDAPESMREDDQSDDDVERNRYRDDDDDGGGDDDVRRGGRDRLTGVEPDAEEEEEEEDEEDAALMALPVNSDELSLSRQLNLDDMEREASAGHASSSETARALKKLPPDPYGRDFAHDDLDEKTSNEVPSDDVDSERRGGMRQPLESLTAPSTDRSAAQPVDVTPKAKKGSSTRQQKTSDVRVELQTDAPKGVADDAPATKRPNSLPPLPPEARLTVLKQSSGVLPNWFTLFPANQVL